MKAYRVAKNCEFLGIREVDVNSPCHGRVLWQNGGE